MRIPAVPIIFAFLLLAPPLSARAGGIEAGNAGGSAEYELGYIWLHLPDFVAPCRDASACGMSALEVTAARALFSGPPAAGFTLALDSASQHPANFPLNADGSVPAYFQAGLKIWVDVDRLYPADLTGFHAPVGFPALVRLATEIGAHTLLPYVTLDTASFSDKVSAFWRAGYQTLDLESYHNSARFLLLSAANGTSRVLFSDSTSAIDLTKTILIRLPCMGASEEATDLIQYSAAYWEPLQLGIDPARLLLSTVASIRYYCMSHATGLTSLVTGQMRLRFSLELSNGMAQAFLSGQSEDLKTELDLGSVRVEPFLLH